ncbi:MAG TPA: DUF4344 domain-containing metallopeptidase [Kofleriaceae bacterium]|nr:DUF4344 domain-containing metallopeptidase [Kofleriaceae bacterium]
MKPSRLGILVVLALASAVSSARAEVVVVSGVELRLPADWDRRTDGRVTWLGPAKHKGRAIMAIELGAMPAATPEAFKALLGEERLELAAVKEGNREGTKAVAASGKLVTAKGPATVDVLVIPVGGKATMLISFVGADQDPVIRKHNVSIIASARVPGPRITIAFKAPKTAGMATPPKAVIEGITKITEAFDQNLRLPRPLAVSFEECGTVNAFYMPAKHAVVMCHDFYDDLIKLFADAGHDERKSVLIADGAFVFTFLHELGHALVGELGLPITGSGESAADELATLILAGSPKAKLIALAGAAKFEAKMKKPGRKTPYFSTHPADNVRFESVLCLLYGSDKAEYGELMKQYKVSPSKLAYCERDTPQRLAAWKKMLQPHALKK